MVDLERAWERALGLIEHAAEFGRHDMEGGTIFGWYPTKPGQAAIVDGRTAWLRHMVYDPLDERGLGSLERQLGRPLPEALRQFYTTCANGVDLLGEDVSVYGLRRGQTLDPFDLVLETSDPPADSDARQVFIGSLGDHGNLLYLDADDERLHLSGLNSVSPLQTWPGLGDFLVATLEEQLRCSWAADGCRVGQVLIPDETAEPIPKTRRALQVPGDLADRAEDVRRVLAEAPESLAVGEAVIVLAGPDELGDMQLGYSTAADGSDLRGDKPGDWRASWIVIGTDEDLGDPFFVDLAEPELPVFTAMHGAGTWDPKLVASSLQGLLASA